MLPSFVPEIQIGVLVVTKTHLSSCARSWNHTCQVEKYGPQILQDVEQQKAVDGISLPSYDYYLTPTVDEWTTWFLLA